jgi:hypothetical protein
MTLRAGVSPAHASRLRAPLTWALTTAPPICSRAFTASRYNRKAWAGRSPSSPAAAASSSAGRVGSRLSVAARTMSGRPGAASSSSKGRPPHHPSESPFRPRPPLAGGIRPTDASSGLRESVSVGAEAGQPLRMRRLLPSGAPRSPQMPKLRQLSWKQSAFVSGQVGRGSRLHFADRITETAVPAVRARCSIKDAAAQQVRCCPHSDLHTRRKPRWNDRHGFLPRVARAAPARAWLVRLVHPWEEIAVKGRRWLPGRRHCVARVVPVLHAETR